MNAPAALGKVEQIRARDGDACWLCNRPLDFSAEPNSKNAPTIEHLVAKSLGGGGELTNLALCHPGCNGHLGDRPLAKKQELRAKWHANTAKVAAAKASTSAKAPTTKLVVRNAVSPPTPPASAPLSCPSARRSLIPI
nr:HNH endonuclease [uncultured Sphingomonas sp.]